MYACIYNIWIFVHNGIPYTPFGVWLSVSLVAMTSASMQQQDISGYEAAVGPSHHVAMHACWFPKSIFKVITNFEMFLGIPSIS